MKIYLEKEYCDQQLSTRAIGKNLGISNCTVGDWLKYYNITTRGNTEKIRNRNCQNSNPTQQQWQVILGSWLGDGNLRRQSNTANTGIRLCHCPAQEEYLNYKKSILEQNGLFKFSQYTRKSNGVIHIESQKHSILNYIYENCYTYGSAIFNIDYFKQLTSFGLYIWYLDDGSLQHNSHIVLCTDKFSYEDNITINNELFNKFGFKGKMLQIRNKQYRIRYNKENSIKFLNTIGEFDNEVQCMKYKFNIKETKNDCIPLWRDAKPIS